MSITPLSLVKAHCVIDHDADDLLLDHYASSAESWIASYIGAPFAADDPRMVQAVLLMVAHSYACREAASADRTFSTPYGIADLLSGLKARITGYVPAPEPEATP